MSNKIESYEQEVVERIFAEFNEELRTTGHANFDYLEQCPVARRQELRGLMNVAALTFHAFEPERKALEETGGEAVG